MTADSDEADGLARGSWAPPLFPGAYTLANLLPFISLGWLLIGAIAAGILRARRNARFRALGRAVAPNLDK